MFCITQYIQQIHQPTPLGLKRNRKNTHFYGCPLFVVGGAKRDTPRNYWIIQQDNNQSGKSLLEGRAYSIQTTGFAGTTNVSWADIHTENSNNVRGAGVICYDHYEMQDGYYQLINKRVEAYKPTGSMLNSHTPEMYWETVTDNPEYQCPS